MVEGFDILTRLANAGWMHVTQAVTGSELAELCDVRYVDFTAAPPVDGVVRQSGLRCYLPYAETAPPVLAFGNALHRELSAAAQTLGLTEIPSFNETSWSRYPEGVGHISAHRDPAVYSGVIAILTLVGSATFRVWEEEQVRTAIVQEGDLVLLRGDGWPTNGARCLRHEVDRPIRGERVIMTLRHNRRGASGGYEVLSHLSAPVRPA